MLQFLIIWGCFNVRTRSTLYKKSNFFFSKDCLADCAGHRKKEEAAFSIMSLHLQVTCSFLSSAKLQRKVVMAQQTVLLQAWHSALVGQGYPEYKTSCIMSLVPSFPALFISQLA